MNTRFFITAVLAAVLLMGPAGESRAGVDSNPENVITFTTAKAVGEEIRLAVDAHEADRAGVWIDLNNNGVRDAGEAVTRFADGPDDAWFKLGAQTISIYGKVTALFCFGNGLTALDLSRNPDLAKLHCEDNVLAELELSNNPGLIELHCANNRITALDVSGNPDLTELWCGGNQITGLDLSNNVKLTELHCGGNKIMGEKANALIAGLPDRTGKKTGLFVIFDPSGETADTVELNEISDVQKAAAAEKNWRYVEWHEWYNETRKN